MYVEMFLCDARLTLDDGQQDDNDEEKEGDVKDDPVKLIVVTCWVLDLVPNAPASTHAHIHVKKVALGAREREGRALEGEPMLVNQAIGFPSPKSHEWLQIPASLVRVHV